MYEKYFIVDSPVVIVIIIIKLMDENWIIKLANINANLKKKKKF